MTIEEACDMLVKTLDWRHDFKVENLKNESYPQFDKLGFKYGKDKRGIPVTYNFYKSLTDEDIIAQLESFKRWRIQLMESAIDDLDFEKGIDTIIQVHDYTGVGLFSDKRVKTVSGELIAIFQNHYPEFLYKKFFCGVPYFMEFLFSTVGLLVPKKTREKFVLVGAGKTKTALLEFVDPNELPSVYGGFEASTVSENDSIKQITIPARQSVKEVVAVKKGQIVSWDYITKALDIGVCIGIAKDLNAPVGPITRDEYGKGSLEVAEDGHFTLCFNNEYSLMTEKNVYYRVVVE
jgi:hypothetical protein